LWGCFSLLIFHPRVPSNATAREIASPIQGTLKRRLRGTAGSGPQEKNIKPDVDEK
jgi:hypothetical protein